MGDLLDVGRRLLTEGHGRNGSPILGRLDLLSWASGLAEQGVELDAPVTYLETPLRRITTKRVSWYAREYLLTIFNARYHVGTFIEASLVALTSLRQVLEGVVKEDGEE